MKLFLFMYPIEPFFDEIQNNLWYSFRDDGGPLNKEDLYGINQIIETRYRDNGFQIAWVYYGKKNKKHLPEINNATKYIRVQPKDHVLSSNTHTGEPDFEYIFSQIPEKVDELIVGGFHWMSCVAFTADYAIETLGIPTRVDEDTTQVYFAKLSILRRIQRRDINPLGETYQPWHISELLQDQEFYSKMVLLKPWIVLNPPADELTFRQGKEFVNINRAKLESDL